MWLLAADLPLRMQILDQAGQALGSLAARLEHLDEQYAVLILDEPVSAARLHWGSPVRFELEDGLRRYEITGVIITRQESVESVTAEEDTNAPRAARWEVRVRIWECNLNVQRRTLPRRALRFPVSFRPLCGNESVSTEIDLQGETASGWCVDIGAGGIKIRTPRLASVPGRMALRFRLPVSTGEDGSTDCHDFCLSGKVIRAELRGRSSDSMEIALRFERLAVRDGLVLRNLLS